MPEPIGLIVEEPDPPTAAEQATKLQSYGPLDRHCDLATLAARTGVAQWEVGDAWEGRGCSQDAFARIVAYLDADVSAAAAARELP